MPKAHSAAALHAALADPTREAIARLLAAGERAVGEIADQLPVSRPAVSKHLRVLEGAGLVRHRSVGTRNVYALEPAALAALRDEVDALWRTALARYALVADNTDPARRRRRRTRGDPA
jgi:DNA-binding transcriptional ArsR family regulator